MLKITRAPNLIQSDLCYLELDGMQVGTVYAFAGCYDRIREALEEREATPEESYLLEEQGRELAKAELLIEKLKEEVGHWEDDFAMFDRAHEKAINLWRKEHPDAGYTPDISDLNEWMVLRVEKAEAVKESLTSALKEICVYMAHWKTVENGRGRAIAWVWQTASTALRTAEESSVVDSTPAKQPEAITKLDKALQGGVMTHTPELLRVIEQNERDKTLECVRLEDNKGVFVLVSDEKYGERLAALWNMAERLGMSTEDIESGNVEIKLKATSDMLEALETIMDIGDKACRDIARAAIRKARGEG